MEIVFMLHPNPDACTRCKQAAYVNGKNADDGYNVHVVSSDEFKQIGVVHKNCRCAVEVIDGDVDNLKTEEFLDKTTADIKDYTHLNPDQLGGFVPYDLEHTTLPYKPGKHLTRIITHHHRTKRNPGNTFFTVVAEPLVKLMNVLFKKLGGR